MSTEDSTDEGQPTTDAGQSTPEAVTISAVTGLPRNGQEMNGFWLFVEKLEEEAPWIEIDYRGGPDVIGATDQIEAVTSGAVDLGAMPQVYYEAQAPVADIMKFSPYAASAERENGLFELYDRFHDELLGVRYLGNTTTGLPYVYFTTVDMSEPDFSGQVIRSSSGPAATVEALGGEVVNLPGGEVYTALERGVIDGVAWGAIGVAGNGWHEVLEYEIAPRVYNTVISVVINSDTWDSLDEATQSAMTEAMEEVEIEIFDQIQDAMRAEVEEWRSAGVELIQFEGEDEQRFLEAAYVDAWDAVDWEAIVSQVPYAEDIRETYEAGYGEDFVDAVPGGRTPPGES